MSTKPSDITRFDTKTDTKIKSDLSMDTYLKLTDVVYQMRAEVEKLPMGRDFYGTAMKDPTKRRELEQRTHLKFKKILKMARNVEIAALQQSKNCSVDSVQSQPDFDINLDTNSILYKTLHQFAENSPSIKGEKDFELTSSEIKFLQREIRRGLLAAKIDEGRDLYAKTNAKFAEMADKFKEHETVLKSFADLKSLRMSKEPRKYERSLETLLHWVSGDSYFLDSTWTNLYPKGLDGRGVDGYEEECDLAYQKLYSICKKANQDIQALEKQFSSLLDATTVNEAQNADSKHSVDNNQAQNIVQEIEQEVARLKAEVLKAEAILFADEKSAVEAYNNFNTKVKDAIQFYKSLNCILSGVSSIIEEQIYNNYGHCYPYPGYYNTMLNKIGKNLDELQRACSDYRKYLKPYVKENTQHFVERHESLFMDYTPSFFGSKTTEGGIIEYVGIRSQMVLRQLQKLLLDEREDVPADVRERVETIAQAKRLNKLAELKAAFENDPELSLREQLFIITETPKQNNENADQLAKDLRDHYHVPEEMIVAAKSLNKLADFCAILKAEPKTRHEILEAVLRERNLRVIMDGSDGSIVKHELGHVANVYFQESDSELLAEIAFEKAEAKKAEEAAEARRLAKEREEAAREEARRLKEEADRAAGKRPTHRRRVPNNHVARNPAPSQPQEDSTRSRSERADSKRNN